MPRIPNGLKPIVTGYSYGGPGGVISTEVEGGMPRSALDYDRGPQPFRVTLVLTKLKHQVWTYFYHNEIKKGAVSFEMEIDSGLGLSFHDVTMIPDTYNVASNGAMWSVAFAVRAESQAYANPEAGESLIAAYNVYGDSLPKLLAALEKFATVDSNVLDFE